MHQECRLWSLGLHVLDWRYGSVSLSLLFLWAVLCMDSADMMFLGETLYSVISFFSTGKCEFVDGNYMQYDDVELSSLLFAILKCLCVNWCML
jgi:hypothetical protein